jgi:uncharacterized protein (DUF362 family)
MPLVSVVKTDENRIDEAVNKTVDLISGLEAIKGKKNVSIKPNLCTPKSSASGATTDRRIVEALVRKINSVMSCKINIVETNNSKASADQTFDYLGYDALSQRYKNVRCVNLSKDAKVRVHINGEIFSSMRVPESMIFSDCLISVAKLKTHVDYLYTGVLKNQYGFLLGPRAQYHGFMSKAITDLNRFYKPDLSIIDGVIGMEGFGPTDGAPKHVGVLIASKDPVAADAVAARIIGIKPSRIGYLKHAKKKGIGTWENIEVVGCNVDEVVTSFAFIPTKYYYFGKFSLALQRYSRYVKNFAEFLSLTRSGLSTIGFSAIEKRMSYSGLWRLATNTIFRVEE